MPVIAFDTLKFANSLKAVGVPERQAEAEANLFAELFSVNFKELVTKDDLRQAINEVEGKLRESEQRLNFKIDQMKTDLIARDDQGRAELTIKIEQVRSELNGKIDRLSGDVLLMKWMLGFIISGVAVLIIRGFFASSH